jgi:hypothetical protein
MALYPASVGCPSPREHMNVYEQIRAFSRARLPCGLKRGKESANRALLLAATRPRARSNVR